MRLARTTLLTATALVMAILVMTMPVAAGPTVLVERDTNAGDFTAGSNQEVERGGTAAYVGHDQYASSAVAIYRMNNESYAGTFPTLWDHAGTNDGTISAATPTTGVRGGALSFDGVDDYATVPVGDYTGTDGAFTISAWVRPDSATTGGLIYDRDGGSNGIRLRESGRLTVDSGDDLFETTVSLPQGDWTHIAVSFDGSLLRVFVDGEQVAYRAFTGDIDNAEPFELGRGDGNNGDGSVDDLRIYSSGFTPGEVRRLAESPAAKQSPTATERWALDAGQGSTGFGDEGDDAALQAGTSWTAGVSGQALNFDGSSDATADVSTGSFDGMDGLTVSTWVRADTTGSQYQLLHKGTDSSAVWQLKLQSGGSFGFDVEDSSGTFSRVDSTTTATAGQWYHVVGVYTGDKIRIYINGSLEEEVNANGDPVNSLSSSLWLGSLGGSVQNLDGALDDTRIYRSALSGQEVGWLTDHPGAQLPDSSSSPISSASLSDGSTVEVDYQTLNTSATLRAVDGSGSTLDTTTVSGDGTATLDVSGSSYSSLDLEFAHDAADATDPDHYARVMEVRYYFEDRDPIVDASTASPNDAQTTQEGLPTLSVDVADPDFATPQGDRLTATFYLNGNAVGTDTLNSNGTVTQSLSTTGVSGGTQNWSVEVDDDWGATTSAPGGDGWPFVLPSQLQIRNELTGDLIKGQNVSVDVRFYSDTTVEERSTSTGNLSMSGLPVGEEFILVAETEGYYTRRIIVDSLVQQQSVYLLNESAPAVQNNFILQDFSSRFDPATTKLVIEKVINDSEGDVGFRTIAGDYFGSAGSGFPVVLEEDARYRLKVINEDGEVRDLGAYTAAQAGDQPIRLGQVQPPRPKADTYVAVTNSTSLDNGDRRLMFTYIDDEQKTTNFALAVYPAGQPENPVYTDDWNGPRGEYTTTVVVPDDSTTYIVNWTAERDGRAIGDTKPVGGVTAPIIPVDNHLLAGVVFVAIVFLLAQAVPAYRGEVAMTTTAFGGIAMALQVIDISPYGWWGAAVISVGIYIAGRQGR